MSDLRTGFGLVNAAAVVAHDVRARRLPGHAVLCSLTPASALHAGFGRHDRPRFASLCPLLCRLLVADLALEARPPPRFAWPAGLAGSRYGCTAQL